VFTYDFSHFLQDAVFITKIASFQLNNVIFIILILNKLKVFYSWFFRFNFIVLQAIIFKE